MSSRSKKPLSNSALGIRAIAEALGVSLATVDRALHNRGRISVKTRARVLAMAERIGYAPNLAARHLRLNQRFRISINLPAQIAEYFDSMQSGIEIGSLPFRSALELEFHRYERGEEMSLSHLRASIRSGVSGIIAVLPNRSIAAEMVAEAKGRDIPVICMSTDVPESGRLTAVTAHPFVCGAMAAEVLVSRMSRRGSVLVLTGPLENLTHTERVRGFRSMLSECSLTHTLAAVGETHDEATEAYSRTHKLLKAHPDLTGVYVSSANSVPVLKALEETGKLQTVSIVTTDLFSGLVPYLRAGSVQATIYQSPQKQGDIAIQTMYRYLAEGVVPSPTIAVVPQLVMKSNLDLYLRTTESLILS